jgi:chorismate-pyruvate lyase
MWLPGHALNCYESDPVLRSWLAEESVLTQRLTRECGAAFRLRVVGENGVEGGWRRQIELLVDDIPWLYAETDVPGATLAQHRWLAELGTRPLGERLAERRDVTRAPLEFCKVYDDDPLVTRALARARIASQPLWVRRSRLALGDAPFILYEVFYPHTGRRAVRAQEAVS